MADHLTPERRSWNMSHIKSRDTTIEVAVRKYLFSKGYRFRKNDKRYPGKPDIVLPKYRTVIFIHGCFWHRHPGCKVATTPKSNTEYWIDKFQRNVANDQRNKEKLIQDGWTVLVLWQCEIENHFADSMEYLEKALAGRD